MRRAVVLFRLMSYFIRDRPHAVRARERCSDGGPADNLSTQLRSSCWHISSERVGAREPERASERQFRPTNTQFLEVVHMQTRAFAT